MASPTSTLTIRVENKTRQRLEKLAKATDRSKSYIAAQAINDYLELQEWQVKEIKAGINEADAGELVSHEEVVNDWGKKRENILDQNRQKKSK